MSVLTEADLRTRVDEEVRHLQDQLLEKDRQLEVYRSEHGQLTHMFRMLKESIFPLEPTPTLYVPKRRKLSVRETCIAAKHSSDGHLGAEQDADEIEGFNVFSPEICEARQLGFTHDYLEWIADHRHSTHIDDLHFLVTGDMISGDIHEELRVTNAFPAPVQACKAGDLLARQVALCAPHFENVYVHFIAEDNHGRMTKKPQAKEAGMNTLNYVVGFVAQARLENIENVHFNLYPMHEKVVHVGNRQYLLCHGHDVKGWMGLPWYGIERKMGRESQARLQQVMEDVSRAREVGFHKYVFGHWHTPVDLPLYCATGSVSGTDAYDRQAGRHSVPCQSGWLVHPKHAEFDRTNFRLRDS